MPRSLLSLIASCLWRMTCEDEVWLKLELGLDNFPRLWQLAGFAAPAPNQKSSVRQGALLVVYSLRAATTFHELGFPWVVICVDF